MLFYEYCKIFRNIFQLFWRTSVMNCFWNKCSDYLELCFSGVCLSLYLSELCLTSIQKCSLMPATSLTLSWRRALSYRNQSTDLQSKSKDWFLYENGIRHERVKKETLAQVFSCEFCETSKNIFLYRPPPVVASVFPCSNGFISVYILMTIIYARDK